MLDENLPAPGNTALNNRKLLLASLKRSQHAERGSAWRTAGHWSSRNTTAGGKGTHRGLGRPSAGPEAPQPLRWAKAMAGPPPAGWARGLPQPPDTGMGLPFPSAAAPASSRTHGRAGPVGRGQASPQGHHEGRASAPPVTSAVPPVSSPLPSPPQYRDKGKDRASPLVCPSQRRVAPTPRPGRAPLRCMAGGGGYRARSSGPAPGTPLLT